MEDRQPQNVRGKRGEGHGTSEYNNVVETVRTRDRIAEKLKRILQLREKL